jgi:hypothetical protein
LDENIIALSVNFRKFSAKWFHRNTLVAALRMWWFILSFHIAVRQPTRWLQKYYCTGIKVSGVRIQMLRFAVDIAIIAQDEVNLNSTLESLDDILKSNYKMRSNKKKNRSYGLLQKS